MQNSVPHSASTFAASDTSKLHHAQQEVAKLRAQIHELTQPGAPTYQAGIAEGMKRERARWVNAPGTSAWIHNVGSTQGGKDTIVVYQSRTRAQSQGDSAGSNGWDQISASTYVARSKLLDYEVREVSVIVPPVDAQILPESGAWVHAAGVEIPPKDAAHVYQSRPRVTSSEHDSSGWTQISATQYLARSKNREFDVREIVVLVSSAAQVPSGRFMPTNPTDEMLRAFLAVERPAMFKHGLRREGDGPATKAEIETLISGALKQYGALLAASSND